MQKTLNGYLRIEHGLGGRFDLFLQFHFLRREHFDGGLELALGQAQTGGDRLALLGQLAAPRVVELVLVAQGLRRRSSR